jgi:alkanesulfonate monooxygenase SsuD/methylene tetrahydromethanopterin reductase-like flavin-dependent oxidoreductase (luciferase family)
MMERPIALSVLDLVPISSGSTAAQALANTVDLARACEAEGYVRYWIAEHHLNPGVAGTTPPLVISLVAGATSTIRVGAGAVQMGHQTPLSVVEQFGILDALYPGRIDLGLGRSVFRRAAPRGADDGPKSPPKPGPLERRTDRGLLIPAPVSMVHLLGSPRFALQTDLLQQPLASSPDYVTQVEQVLALLAGTYQADDGTEAHVVPGEHGQLDVWILGSSGGASAEIAGRRGLPFAGNYHVAPSTVLDAVEAYRRAFVPSARLAQPYVAVSADVVVAETDADAHDLAAGYGLWVHSIRSGAGAIEFPTPDQARAHTWTEAEQALVKDRIETQFVGSASSVADQLAVLAAETEADELVITTITHDHGDRVRSYRLLADEWRSRQAASIG